MTGPLSTTQGMPASVSTGATRWSVAMIRACLTVASKRCASRTGADGEPGPAHHGRQRRPQTMGDRPGGEQRELVRSQLGDVGHRCRRVSRQRDERIPGPVGLTHAGEPFLRGTADRHPG